MEGKGLKKMLKRYEYDLKESSPKDEGKIKKEIKVIKGMIKKGIDYKDTEKAIEVLEGYKRKLNNTKAQYVDNGLYNEDIREVNELLREYEGDKG